MQVQPDKKLLGTVEYRPATASDALCLSVLATQVFLDTYATEGIRPVLAREVVSAYSQASFTAALAEPSGRMILAEHNDHLVGFAHVILGKRHELAPSGRQAELLRLYVQAPSTGLGIGTQLLMHAEQLANVAGTTVLWLTPWAHNHRALAFYEQRGYSDCGLTHFRFESETHENRVLAKSLPDGVFSK